MTLDYSKKNLCFFTYLFMQSTIVTCADISYLNNTIRNYFADTRHHEPQFKDYKAMSKEFIFSEFKKFGLDTEYHYFNDSSFGDTIFTNVIGVLKGANFGKDSDKVVGLLAHYDTVSTTKGVDDNGAGVAAILEVARQLHQQKSKREHTVIFISPDLEEYLLKGSYNFIKDWLPTWSNKHYGAPYALLNTTQGCIVLDTMMEYNNSDNSQLIPQEAVAAFQQYFPGTMQSVASDGFEGDFLTLIYRKTPDSALAENFKQSWEAQGRQEFEIESFALPVEEGLPSGIKLKLFGHFLRSDHTNFWRANIPAIFITDSADFRGDMIHCYHNHCDNIEVMLTDDNLRFLAKTADSLARTVNDLAKVLETSGKGSSSPCIVTTAVSIIIFVIFLQL
ncbi:uncharacterized protein LOC123542287 [Mercenaria mercenaria]|uniref:uncharacterized protein LOC123542287 n=1 Tax=Mercenaria mercenaria TaxID=6596 RepID=UPI00234F6389|nr:uncharacterized protein LOC123542287 [Mercenaria mercenaria]